MRSRLSACFVVVCGAIALAPSAAAADTVAVYAGAPPSLRALVPKPLRAKLGVLNPGLNAFLSRRVTIRAGDSVTWSGLARGFHTIDLPGRAAGDLPLLVPGSTITSDNDFAGSPFWFVGHAPALGFNPALIRGSFGGTAYNGTHRIDSGAPVGPMSPNRFTVRFTKPGTYKYFCDVHPGMIGYVVVRAAGKAVPTPRQRAASLLAQLKAVIASAAKLVKVQLPANTVSLGLSAPDGLELYSIFPSTLTVPAGTVVTFTMSANSRDVHTATFGPRAYLKGLANSLNSPNFMQQALYPSDPPQAGPIVLTPTSHGNGFAGTGGLDEDPTTPLPTSGRIKFTTPGSYGFICLIHPFMRGTIVVR